MNKYNAKKTVIDGIVFDSKAEATRWCVLRQMLLAKEITDLQRQVHFQLKAGDSIICNYVADFTYMKDGVYTVEDVKGVLTRDFRLKAKLFKAQYGFPISIYPPRSKKVKKLPPSPHLTAKTYPVLPKKKAKRYE